MMTDSDKNLMDDDDTDSFEALESRLRTPYKKRPSPLVEEKNENHDESGIEPINETVTETEGVGEEVVTTLVLCLCGLVLTNIISNVVFVVSVPSGAGQ